MQAAMQALVRAMRQQHDVNVEVFALLRDTKRTGSKTTIPLREEVRILEKQIIELELRYASPRTKGQKPPEAGVGLPSKVKGGQPLCMQEDEELPKIDFANLKEFRTKLGMSQADFWASFGVAQATGSRYENGRWPPMSVRMLITLFVNKVVNSEDLSRAWGESLLTDADDSEE